MAKIQRTSAPAQPAAPTPAPSPRPVAGLFKPLKGRTEYVRALLWGREGSGKTTAALRASRNGRILVIDSEGGLKADALERLGVDPDRVVVLSPPMGGSLNYETLDAAFHQVKTDLAADPESWYAVVIDSLTELVAALVNFAADDRVTKARARGIQIDQVAQFDTDRGDYGTASKMFRDLLRKFRTLDCHLIVTALERRTVDADTGMTVYGPEVPPAVSSDVRAYMDEVLHFRAASDDKPFHAVSGGTSRYHVKDRSGKLPTTIDNPFFDTIADLINKEN